MFFFISCRGWVEVSGEGLFDRGRRVLYGNGLPFSQKLAENLQDLTLRVKKNKASLIIIDGGVGEGKTTLAVEVADFIQGAEISLVDKAPQIAQGGQEFMKKLRACYELKKKAVIYDEAGDFNRRGALTRFNAMLNRVFETFRAFQIVVILVLPSFDVIDNDLYDKNIPRLLLHCHERGDSYGQFSGYSLYRMMYIKHMMKKLVVKSHAYQRVDQNFRGEFLNLSREREKQLDRLSTKSKLGTLKAQEIKSEGLLSYAEIATKLARSVVWVKKKTSELRIRHKRVVDRKKYFDEGVVDLLADHIDQQEE